MPDRRAGAVGRGRDDDACGVLTRYRADPVDGVGVGEVEEVERRRGDGDQRLVGSGDGIGHLGAPERRRRFGIVDQSLHAAMITLVRAAVQDRFA